MKNYEVNTILSSVGQKYKIRNVTLQLLNIFL